MNNTSILFKALKVGELTLPNRIIMAAMTRMRCDNNTKVPNDVVAEYYSQRASSGLILTECTLVSQRSNAFPGCAGILNEEQVEGWKKVIDAVHKKNGRIALQIWHSGRATHSNLQGGQIPWGPSPIAINGLNIITREQHEVQQNIIIYFISIPHEMTIEDIKFVIYTQIILKYNYNNSKKVLIELRRLDLMQQNYMEQMAIQQINFQEVIQIEEMIYMVDQQKIDLDFVQRLLMNQFKFLVKEEQEQRQVQLGDIMICTMKILLKLDKRQIAFIEIMNSKDDDNYYFYGHPASEKQVPNLLQQLRPSFKGVIIGNVGLTAQTAAQGIEQGLFDAASFGTLYIGNPDLVERFKDNLKLSDSDSKKYFGGNHEGYSDYPPYQG